MGAANKLKELFQSKEDGKAKPKSLDSKVQLHAEQKAKKEKAETELLRKTIQEKLKKDPKLGQKAAQIIEQMINGKK